MPDVGFVTVGSGRLSADILAVVAADYIRNLREEVVKGINGRLRQGLYPFMAPLGYVNNGSGKAKTVDPERGPLIKTAFDVYASKEFPLNALAREMFDRGLRTKRGTGVSKSQWSILLRNPFYMGLIRLRNRKDMFPGLHVPLVTSSVFNQVQLILDGKRRHLRHRNSFLFRLIIRCEHCGLNVHGERQKGHVYYRCPRKTCPKTCIREERFVAAIVEAMKRLNISPDEEPILAKLLREYMDNESEISQNHRRRLETDLHGIQGSIQTLLQRFLDNKIPSDIFNEGHSSLLLQKAACEEKLSALKTEHKLCLRMADVIDGLRTLCQKFCAGSQAEMRNLIGDVFASIRTSGNTINLKLTPLMEEIANREKSEEGWTRLLPVMVKELVENKMFEFPRRITTPV